MALKRITVLISGRGSNLAALINASHASDFQGAVTHVVSSRSDASGLAVAASHAIATTVIDHRRHASRETFDLSLSAAIEASEPDLVVLAGFMRLLSDALVIRHAGRMLNIHPSLLPAYPGLHTHRRAIADRARVHGCTVHFVAPAVDAGPIVAQAAVPVHADDDEATLAARVLAEEHRLLPVAARWFCAGRLSLHQGRARLDGAPVTDGGLLARLHGAT
jgi:phosphoribosylglycinamide formyltransferase-1